MNPMITQPGVMEALAQGTGGKGMEPVLSAAIITAITSLLSGAMGGAAMGQERKYREGQAEKIKPKTPFYMTPYLAGYDKVLMQAVLANLGEQSDEGGLDFGKIMELMGQSQGSQQVIPRSRRLPLMAGGG